MCDWKGRDNCPAPARKTSCVSRAALHSNVRWKWCEKVDT
nr:unknown [Saccharomyces cerevisiae]